MTANKWLTHFSKAIEQIVEIVKGAESPYVQGIKYYEKDLVVRKRFTSSTDRPSVRYLFSDGNHAPAGEGKNDHSSANSQEILVSMEDVRPEETEDQYITSPSAEVLGRNLRVRHSKCIRRSKHRHEPVFGVDRE